MKPSYFKHFKPLKLREGFSLITTLLHPYSKGQIVLSSADPFSHPLIVPNFFSDPRDMKVMIDGLKQALRLVVSSKAFAKFGAKFYNKPNPACYPKFQV